MSGSFSLFAKNDFRRSSKDVKYAKDFSSLDAAVLSIGAVETELVISKTISVSNNLTVPKNIRLIFNDDGFLNINSGKTLSVAGYLHSPVKRIFGGGNVKFIFVPKLISPEWFGAVSVLPSDAMPSAAIQTANTNAVNAAIASVSHTVYYLQLKGFGGTIGFQSGAAYYFNGTIDLSKTTGIVFNSPSRSAAKLIYTASGTNPFIRLDSAQRFLATDLELLYNSANYKGKLVKVGWASDWKADPSQIDFQRVLFSGEGAANQADALLWFDYAIHSKVEDSQFGAAKVGVLGRASTSNLSSNIISVRHNIFKVSEAAVKNPYQSWIIEGNTIEAFGGAKWVLVATDAGLNSFGLTIRNNWIGDVEKSQNVPCIQITAYGGLIEGNYFGGNASETAPAILLGVGSRGVMISANRFEAPKAVDFTGLTYETSVIGNDFAGNGNKILNPQWLGGMILGHSEHTNLIRQDTTFEFNLSIGRKTTIGAGGTPLTQISKGTLAVNPASIAANSYSTQTFPLSGAQIGDAVTLNVLPAGLTAGLLVLQYRVSAANTISITFQNANNSAIDEPAGTWNYLIVR